MINLSRQGVLGQGAGWELDNIQVFNDAHEYGGIFFRLVDQLINIDQYIIDFVSFHLYMQQKSAYGCFQWCTDQEYRGISPVIVWLIRNGLINYQSCHFLSDCGEN